MEKPNKNASLVSGPRKLVWFQSPLSVTPLVQLSLLTQVAKHGM